jgi:hypothetical protein
MDLTLSVSLTDDAGKNHKLGSTNYVASADLTRQDTLEIKEAKVDVPGTSQLTIKSGYHSKNANLTVAAFHEDEQVLLGLCHWDKVTPYFGFRIAAAGFVHLNFKMTEAAGVPH